MSRAGAFVAWIVLVAVAFGGSPPPRPDQGAWLVRLVTFDLEGIEPWVVAHFDAMGLWPFLLAVLTRDRLFAPWRRGSGPAWPFVVGSMALGAFALLPWFVWGRPDPTPLPRAARWLAHPALPAAIGVAGAALVAWAALTGDPRAWAEAFRTEQFIWAMAFDFCALWAISVALATQARAERPAPNPAWCALPLVGAAAWAAIDAAQDRRSAA